MPKQAVRSGGNAGNDYLLREQVYFLIIQILGCKLERQTLICLYKFFNFIILLIKWREIKNPWHIINESYDCK